MRLPRPRAAAVAASLLAAAGLVAVDAAPAAVAVSPAATDLRIAVAVTSDGLGLFTDDDRPGGDSSGRNGIVRTADSIVYAVTVGTTDGQAADGGFDAVAPEGMTWSRLPDECLPGSVVSGRDLRCELGTITSGARTVSVVGTASTSLTHGTLLRPAVTADAEGVGPVEAVVPAVTVSAAPRFDLSMNRVLPVFSAAVGPDGTSPGFRIVYPILMHFESLAEDGGLLGYERLRDGISFVDDVSRMYGREDSPAVLLPVDGAPACGVNTGQMPTAPGGSGGGERAVVDTGTVTCEQSAPGEPVTVQIRGTDTSMASTPTKNVSGGPIPGGVEPYVVSGYVSLWVPQPPESTSFTARNVYRDLDATSVSGRANYDGEGEPLANNVADRNISDKPGVTGSQSYAGWDTASRSSFPLSGKNDEPYVTPGQTLLATTTLNNRGTADWTGTVVCSVFDNSVQRLRESSPGSWAASNRPGTTGRPQFAAFDGSDPERAKEQTCEDDDLAWSEDPRQVEGGPSAVGAVRWTYDHPATVSLGFHVHLTASSRLENYTRMRTFASLRTAPDGEWVHTPGDAHSANSAWSDFLTVTSNTARIRSAVVDPGHDAHDTPDETSFVTAGGTIRYALYPSVTNASDDELPETVVVRDVLPAGAAYVDGSGSLTPTIDEVEVDGVTRQRLTWSLERVDVNDDLPPLTFDARFVRAVVGAEAINTATIESSRDVSAEVNRTTHRALRVLAGSGFDARERVDAPVHVVGDRVVLTLTYGNVGSEALESTSLISVLPFDGDAAGTTTAARPRLDAPVVADGSETVLYTSAESASVSHDPADASNAPGGRTRWCTEAEFGAPGCPRDLAAVTAVRVDRNVAVPSGGEVEHDLVLVGGDGQSDGDVWASRFAIRVAGIDLTASSEVVTSRAVAGSVGHTVWTDLDGDGLQGTDEPGRPAHPVQLSGTDDRGEPVSRSTETDAEGSYSFTGLRPGSYDVAFGTVPGGWTVSHVGDDDALDSDVDETGTASVVLERVTGDAGETVDVDRDDHVDAGALPDPDGPGEPGDGSTPAPPTPGDAGTGTGTGPSSDVAGAGTVATPRRLAFTGAGVAGLGVLAAALLTLGVMGVLRRRAVALVPTDD